MNPQNGKQGSACNVGDICSAMAIHAFSGLLRRFAPRNNEIPATFNCILAGSIISVVR
jgi:hypothetical protein